MKKLSLKVMVVGLDDRGSAKGLRIPLDRSNKLINDKINNRLFSLYPTMAGVNSPIICQNNASTNKIIGKQTGCECK